MAGVSDIFCKNPTGKFFRAQKISLTKHWKMSFSTTGTDSSHVYKVPKRRHLFPYPFLGSIFSRPWFFGRQREKKQPVFLITEKTRNERNRDPPVEFLGELNFTVMTPSWFQKTEIRVIDYVSGRKSHYERIYVIIPAGF